MNMLTQHINAAPHSRKDYTPGGLDGKRVALTIISSSQCSEIMSRLHEQRVRGLLTVKQWRDEQHEVLSRTVPGHVRALFEKALSDVEADRPTSGLYGALVSG